MRKNIVFIIGLIILGVSFFFYNKKFSLDIQDPLLKKIQEQGEIVIGVAATYPPMESINQHGEFIGMDIDIAEEIASDLGVESKFINIVWENLFDAVKDGSVDIIISSITITAERAQVMDFSDPYFNAGQVIVIRSDEKNIKGVEDIMGYNIGVQTETTSEQEAKKYVSDSSFVKSYENYYIAKNDLLEGKIDVIIIDYPAAIGMVAEEKDLRMVGNPFTQEFYGVATQKEQQVLLSQINDTIRRLKREEKFEALEQKWLLQ